MTDYTNMNRINESNNVDGRRSLFVDVSFSDGTLKACLVGPRIGEREATVVANALNAQIKQYDNKVTSLVLDFSAVQFISSLGLGMCIDVRNTAHSHFKSLHPIPVPYVYSWNLNKIYNFRKSKPRGEPLLNLIDPWIV